MIHDAIRSAAREFFAASFHVLEEDRVIPTPAFHPFIKVGRDYFGHDIMALTQFIELERLLNSSFPDRFAEPLKRHTAEFAQTYMFSLLDACVARCGSRGESFDVSSPSVDASIDELIDVLESDTYELICCRVVSHMTTDTGNPVSIGDVEVVPERGDRDDLLRRIAQEIPGAAGVFNRDRS